MDEHVSCLLLRPFAFFCLTFLNYEAFGQTTGWEKDLLGLHIAASVKSDQVHLGGKKGGERKDQNVRHLHCNDN